MGEKNSKCLLILAVILSAAALTVSLLLLGWTVFVELTESDDIAELRNRLEDLETEHDYILDKEFIPATKSLISPPQFCSLLPDPGPCGSQVTRWYYLPREEDCIQFPWGGCQGNDNNFVSIHQCRAACHVPQDKQVSTSLYLMLAHVRTGSPGSIMMVESARGRLSRIIRFSRS